MGRLGLALPGVVVLALLAAAAPWVSGHELDGDVTGHNRTHRTVCVMAYSVIDVCGTSGTLDFSGYEPELFKLVTQYMADNGHAEWMPGNWSFTCFLDTSTAYDTIIEALNNGTCDVAMGGVVSDEVMGKDVKLSYSTYHTGRRIMVYRAYPPTLWAFLRPMSYGVWMIAFLSTVVIAIAVVMLDSCWPVSSASSAAGARLTWEAVWRGYSSTQWSTAGLFLLSVHQLSPRSPGARLVVAGFAFTSLLLFCMYTASSSAAITVSTQREQITKLEHLQRLAVGVWEGDKSAFTDFALSNIYSLVWNTDADGEAMLELLRQGRLDALILDDPFVQYQTSRHCDLFATGDIVEPGYMVWMFPGAVTEQYVEHFDAALQLAWELKKVRQLFNKYVHSVDMCPEQPPLSSYTQVSLHEIGGLWIFLAACLGFGLLWNLLHHAAPHLWHSGSNSSSSGGGSSNAGPPNTSAWSPYPSGSLGSQGLKSVPELPEAAKAEQQAEASSWALGWPQATVDDRLITLHARLDELEAMMQQLPQVMGESMDRQLLVLRVEMARVITGQIRRQMISRQASATGSRNISQRDNARRVAASSSCRQLRSHLLGAGPSSHERMMQSSGLPRIGTWTGASASRPSLGGAPPLVLPQVVMCAASSGDVATRPSMDPGPSSSSGPSGRASGRGSVEAGTFVLSQKASEVEPLWQTAVTEEPGVAPGQEATLTEQAATEGEEGLVLASLAASGASPAPTLALTASQLKCMAGSTSQRLVSSASQVQEALAPSIAFMPVMALALASQTGRSDVSELTSGEASCGAFLLSQDDLDLFSARHRAAGTSPGTRTGNDVPAVVARKVSEPSSRKLSEPPGRWRQLDEQDVLQLQREGEARLQAQGVAQAGAAGAQGSEAGEEPIRQLLQWAGAAGVQLDVEAMTPIQLAQLQQLAKLVVGQPLPSKAPEAVVPADAGAAEGSWEMPAGPMYAMGGASAAAMARAAAAGTGATALQYPPSPHAMPMAPALGAGLGALPGDPWPGAMRAAALQQAAALDIGGVPWAAVPPGHTLGAGPSLVQGVAVAPGDAGVAVTVAPVVAVPLPNIGMVPLQPVTDTFYEDDDWYEEDDFEEEEEEPQSYEIP